MDYSAHPVEQTRVRGFARRLNLVGQTHVAALSLKIRGPLVVKTWWNNHTWLDSRKNMVEQKRVAR